MSEAETAKKPAGHSGATGWEALIPLDWDRLRRLTNEPVPRHIKRWWFSLGGTPAYLFFIQITTGILLTFYYQPGFATAYDSVARISNEVPFGWFVRSIHKWSANLMIVTVLLHLLRTFFTRAYRHPRQLNWIFGVTLLLLTLALGFTGYSLINEQLSYWGATVAANLTESVPLLGKPMALLLRGGPEIGTQTLTRLYLLHVGLLPLLMIGVLGLHLTFVRLHGVTEYEFEPARAEARRPFPIHLVLAGLAGAGALLAAVVAVRGATVFDLVGYRFLPGTSRALFAMIAAALAAGAAALARRRFAGLLVFLTAVALAAAKVVRDLLTGEAASPAAFGWLLAALVAVLLAGALCHRRFKEKEDPAEPKTFSFFPDHMLTELMIGTGLLFLLTILCLLFPAELGERANPQVTPDHIKPEWYFYFQFRVLKLSPGLFGLTSLDVSVLLTGLILAILFLWPWIDGRIERLFPKKEVPVLIGISGFLLWLGFTVWEAMVH
ncbi:MAG: cytochrome b N-terminal domain-containing protein [Planctomycetes bacterium]|jgi:quinol-cytochrome oxidoreductase complex cytochrome b subunit|nr:cytochrome b N-terminal domain-containing protein [Planctomycetota bacterium]